MYIYGYALVYIKKYISIKGQIRAGRQTGTFSVQNPSQNKARKPGLRERKPQADGFCTKIQARNHEDQRRLPESKCPSRRVWFRAAVFSISVADAFCDTQASKLSEWWDQSPRIWVPKRPQSEVKTLLSENMFFAIPLQLNARFDFAMGATKRFQKPLDKEIDTRSCFGAPKKKAWRNMTPRWPL